QLEQLAAGEGAIGRDFGFEGARAFALQRLAQGKVIRPQVAYAVGRRLVADIVAAIAVHPEAPVRVRGHCGAIAGGARQPACLAAPCRPRHSVGLHAAIATLALPTGSPSDMLPSALLPPRFPCARAAVAILL